LLGRLQFHRGEALYLKEYINSADMLKVLDKQLDFHDAWSHSGLDFIHHLLKTQRQNSSSITTATVSLVVL
jgi:capsule polysaccharide export protein KpsE/RkpR